MSAMATMQPEMGVGVDSKKTLRALLSVIQRPLGKFQTNQNTTSFFDFYIVAFLGIF